MMLITTEIEINGIEVECCSYLIPNEAVEYHFTSITLDRTNGIN